MNDSADLLPLVYDRLRKFARSRLNVSDTLFGTGLVHEGYLRLQSKNSWESEAHFFHALRNAMRNAIVDHLRKKAATKRGGGMNRVPLGDMDAQTRVGFEEIVFLADALDLLAQQDERAASVVTMRFFGCLSDEEVAQELGISKRTVIRDWIYAKAWLRAVMGEAGATTSE